MQSDREGQSGRMRRLSLAAGLVVATLILLGAWNMAAPTAMTPKTLQVPGAYAIVQEAPLTALIFYIGDSLFVAFALWMFFLLAQLARKHPWLLALGLAAALAKAGADWTENLGLAWPALQAMLGQEVLPAIEAQLWLVDLIKRLGGCLSALAFGVLYPRKGLSGKLAAYLLLATALFTAAGFVFPLFMQANAALLFFAATAIAWDAHRHARS